MGVARRHESARQAGCPTEGQAERLYLGRARQAARRSRLCRGRHGQDRRFPAALCPCHRAHHRVAHAASRNIVKMCVIDDVLRVLTEEGLI